jgi:hypothetical protein
MSLAHLIYLSESRIAGDVNAELLAINRTAHFINPKLDVTGLLLYNAGQFLQVLEGHGLVIERLFQKISADARHANVCKLVSEPIESRLFEQWSMGVMNLELASVYDQQRFADLVTCCQVTPTSRLVPKLFREFRKQLTHQPTADEEAPLAATTSALVNSFRQTYERVAATSSQSP